jgi:DNA polymerase-1
MKVKTVVLVDGMNLVHKSAYSYAQLKTANGVYSGAVFGVLSQIFSLHSRIKDEFKTIVFWEGSAPDEKGVPVKSWREKLIQKTYKAGRKRNEDAIRAIKQVPAIMGALNILGIPQMFAPGLEADDLIGIAASELENNQRIKKVIIFSSDKDFLQCVTEKVHVYRSLKGTIEVFTPKKVQTEFGVPAKLFASYKALIGDTSDNYKGLPGVGPAKAVELINAGIRPAKANWEDHKPEVIKPYGPRISDKWQDAHKCFQLAFIPRSCKYKLLPKDMQAAAKVQMRAMHRALVAKHSVEDSKTRMQQWIKFCSQYELTTFLASRRKILERYLG